MRLSKKYLFLILSLLLFLYSGWIEPYWIEISSYKIQAGLVRPVKIIQISDLHSHGFFKRERMVIETVEKEKPDLIVISGDTISNHGSWNEIKYVLSRLKAPLGTILVRGNWEYWNPSPEEERIYKEAKVIFLNNSSKEVFKNLWVIGIDDSLAGSPNARLAFSKVPQRAFKIALFHSPAFFDQIVGKFNLGLAGHTHGGQIKIPFLTPFWLPEGSGKYVAGWYESDSSKMYVSRGIGNSIVDFRFSSRPEISIFNLE